MKEQEMNDCFRKKGFIFNLTLVFLGLTIYQPVISAHTNPPLVHADAVKNHHNKLIVLNAKNPEVASFIDEMVKTHHFNRNKLIKLFDKVTYQPKIIKLMERPAEKRLTWEKYRSLFMKPFNIKNGVKFWKENHHALIKAENTYGVSPVAIVGILGVETRFGRITGGYKAIDALSTLAFSYPPREKFFKKELSKLLLLSRQEKMNPLTLTGSYAGALGMPQFMPSSYLAYAVDFTKSGQADIWSTPADAIGSIANYLKVHGWTKGEKIAVPAVVTNKGEQVISKSPVTTMSVEQAKQQGLLNTKWLPSTSRVRGLKLDGKKGAEYWMTTNNFYAITRYNRSDLYAMAVYQLGSAIKKEYKASIKSKTEKTGKTVKIKQDNKTISFIH